MSILDNPMIIGFSETWLKLINEAFYVFPGYSLYVQSRISGSRGGVAICVKQGLSSEQRIDLANLLLISAKSVLVDIRSKTGGQSIIVCEIYHPLHKSPIDSITNLGNLPDTVTGERAIVY